jgi:flagellar biosynthesis anti-sigma factor FlgM
MMKITGRKSQPAGPLSPMTGPVADDASQVEPAGPELESDSVDMASSTQVGKLAQAVQAMPNVRPGKVEELREQIDDGSYYVESPKLAHKVVDEALSDIMAGEWKTF